MKFCVMKTAQGNTVRVVQTSFGEQHDRQYVVGLQMISSAATAAMTVARPHLLRPFLASPALPERLFGATVDIVGVVLAGGQPCQGTGLSLASLARSRAIGTVATPVLTGFADAPAHFACDAGGPRVG